MILSVVIPVFNRPVRALIDSIAPQRSIELIVVDDCSTTRIDVPERPDLTFVRNLVNMGPGQSRNAGLGMARGKYVFFLDSDDAVGAAFFERLVPLLKTCEVDVLQIELLMKSGMVVKRYPLRIIDGRFFPAMLQGKFFYTSPVDKILRREFLLAHDIRFPSMRAYEDVVFVRLVAFHMRTIRYLEGFEYIAALTSDSVSRNTRSQIENLERLHAVSQAWEAEKGLSATDIELLRAADAAVVIYETFRFAMACSSFSIVRKERARLRALLGRRPYTWATLTPKYKILHLLSTSAPLLFVAARLFTSTLRLANDIKATRSKLGS